MRKRRKGNFILDFKPVRMEIKMNDLQNKILQRNVLDLPWPIPDNSIDCCVTSPPYWALRNYGVDGQIGMEETPDLFVQALVKVFEEVKRVLKPEGTLWVNIGDTYYGGKGSNGASKAYTNYENTLNKKALIATTPGEMRPNDRKIVGLKQKDLVGIPWMLAFALRSAGWYLRQDIIWSKPNPMPESVSDRCTRSHEYIFMFSKSPKYYYDYEAIKTPGLNPADDIRRIQKATLSGKSTPGLNNGIRQDKQRGHSRRHNGFNDRWDAMSVKEQQSMGANKRSVWDVEEDRYKVWEWLFKNADESLIEPLWEKFLLEQQKESVWKVSTAMYKDAHFATFPEALITPCILAGCPKDGIVLDHFMGAGTTAVVAKSHGRNYIGYELNPEYIEIANKRLKKHFGMFA